MLGRVLPAMVGRGRRVVVPLHTARVGRQGGTGSSMVLLPPPGYTSHTAAALGVITAPAACTVRRHRAQSGRIPWVRDIPQFLILLSVKICRECCAELLRSS